MPFSVLERAATTCAFSVPRPPFAAVAGATHISIVHFHNSVQQILCITLTHSGTDTIQQIPCGFIANAQGVLKLDGKDPPLVSGHEPDGPEPDVQRQMGAVHDRSSGDGGLMATGAALVNVPTLDGIELRPPHLGQTKPSENRKRNNSVLQVSSVAKRSRNSLNLISSACAMLISSCFLSGDIIARMLYYKADDYKMLWFAELSR